MGRNCFLFANSAYVSCGTNNGGDFNDIWQFVNTSGVNELSGGSSFNVYPTTTSGMVWMKGVENKTVLVFNSAGQKIMD